MADPTPGPGDERGPNSYPLKPRFEYRAPSFLWEHRYLLIAFVLAIIVALAGVVYLIRAPHKPMKIEPPAPPPVYVEPIPARPASSAQ